MKPNGITPKYSSYELIRNPTSRLEVYSALDIATSQFWGSVPNVRRYSHSLLKDLFQSHQQVAFDSSLSLQGIALSIPQRSVFYRIMFFSYAITISDITVSSTAFLSLKAYCHQPMAEVPPLSPKQIHTVLSLLYSYFYLLNGWTIYLIVIFMSTNPANEDVPNCKLNNDNQPIVVASDIET